MNSVGGESCGSTWRPRPADCCYDGAREAPAGGGCDVGGGHDGFAERSRAREGSARGCRDGGDRHDGNRGRNSHYYARDAGDPPAAGLASRSARGRRATSSTPAAGLAMSEICDRAAPKQKNAFSISDEHDLGWKPKTLRPEEQFRYNPITQKVVGYARREDGNVEKLRTGAVPPQEAFARAMGTPRYCNRQKGIAEFYDIQTPGGRAHHDPAHQAALERDSHAFHRQRGGCAALYDAVINRNKEEKNVWEVTGPARQEWRHGGKKALLEEPPSFSGRSSRPMSAPGSRGQRALRAK